MVREFPVFWQAALTARMKPKFASCDTDPLPRNECLHRWQTRTRTKMSVKMVRYVLRQRAQRPEENVQAYVTALREFVDNCTIGDLTEEWIH